MISMPKANGSKIRCDTSRLQYIILKPHISKTYIHHVAANKNVNFKIATLSLGIT